MCKNVAFHSHQTVKKKPNDFNGVVNGIGLRPEVFKTSIKMILSREK